MTIPDQPLQRPPAPPPDDIPAAYPSDQPVALSYATPIANVRGIAIRQWALLYSMLGLLVFTALLIIVATRQWARGPDWFGIGIFLAVPLFFLATIVSAIVLGVAVLSKREAVWLCVAVFALYVLAPSFSPVLAIFTPAPVLYIHYRATKFLRKHGAQAGWFGARLSQFNTH